MVDKPKLDQMLSSLRGYVQILKGLGAAPRDEFLAKLQATRARGLRLFPGSR